MALTHCTVLVPKTKKPLTTAPLRFPKRGEACVNGFKVLTATTTIEL